MLVKFINLLIILSSLIAFAVSNDDDDDVEECYKCKSYSTDNDQHCFADVFDKMPAEEARRFITKCKNSNRCATKNLTKNGITVWERDCYSRIFYKDEIHRFPRNWTYIDMYSHKEVTLCPSNLCNGPAQGSNSQSLYSGINIYLLVFSTIWRAF